MILVQTDGEEEPQLGAEEEEQTAAETGNASQSPNKTKKIKNIKSLMKLQPKGEWKMYDNLSVDHNRHNEQGRLQRHQDRPNYDDKWTHVFGPDPDQKKKKSAAKTFDKAAGKKPRGRPPKGKMWDDDAGAYVSDEDAPDAKKAKTSTSATKKVSVANMTKAELVSEVSDMKSDMSTMRAEMAEMRAMIASFKS